MTFEFDKTMGWDMIIEEIKTKFNGNAPDGFKYMPSIRGDKIVITAKQLTDEDIV